MHETNELSMPDIIKKYNLILLIFYFVISTIIFVPEFLSLRNNFNVLRNASFTGIMSIGMTFVILTSEINLSVGYMKNMAGMLYRFLIIVGMPIFFGNTDCCCCRLNTWFLYRAQ